MHRTRGAVTHSLGTQPGKPLGRVLVSAGADGGSGSGAFDVRFPKSANRSQFPSVRIARSIPPASCRHRGLSLLKRQPSLAPIPDTTSGTPAAMLHCVPISQARGKYLQFHSFDEAYLARLRSGDFRAQEHFSAYFGALIKIKLGSRLHSRETIEDLRQETFARFFTALREGKILQPERLGSFVNSICNNVLLEYYRLASRSTSLDEEEKNFPVSNFDLVEALGAKETEKKVRAILEKLPERDRRLLREVFLEERDKDEVCRDFGVDREYLRVLLHRAKQAFKSTYLRHMGENPPDYSPA